MKREYISIVNIAAFLLILVILIYSFIQLKTFLVPIIFGLLLSFLLHPIRQKIKRIVKYEGLSIALSIIVLLLPVALIVYIFTVQFTDIISSLPSITDSVREGVNKAIDYISDRLPISTDQKQNILNNSLQTIVSAPLNFLQTSLATTTATLFNIGMTLLYSIFFLYYFKSFKNFILYQVDNEARPKLSNMLQSIKTLTQKYLSGMGIVIIVLSILNSIGLSIIGIDYAIFWGCLAGLLTVIPYIGTTLGGTLPFLFALATTSTFWQPAAVVIYYAAIQQVEGNLITPNIVGNQVDINPLVAIIALITLGSVWGVSGIILALPLVAILRIFLEQFDPTMPLAILFGSDIYSEDNLFEERYNEERYRLSSIFKDQEEVVIVNEEPSPEQPDINDNEERLEA